MKKKVINIEVASESGTGTANIMFSINKMLQEQGFETEMAVEAEEETHQANKDEVKLVIKRKQTPLL